MPTYKSPDGSFELILREDPNDEDDQIDGPGHGKHYVLRDLKTGTETEFSKIPGFYGAFEILHDNQDKNRYFLFDGSLRRRIFRFAPEQHRWRHGVRARFQRSATR